MGQKKTVNYILRKMQQPPTNVTTCTKNSGLRIRETLARDVAALLHRPRSLAIINPFEAREKDSIRVHLACMYIV